MNVSHRYRLHTLPLLALILLAWGLYLHRLDAQSLWYDEGVTANLAQRTLVDLTRWTAHDIQPPLYYYVVWGWGRLVGWSEWSLRFVSVWWGVLGVPLLAVLARRLTGRRLASLVAALLIAVHPLLVYYSQEARMYTMLTALGILAGYVLLRIREDGSSTWRVWGLYGLVATATVYTHYFAFFLLLALGVAFLIDHLYLRHRHLIGFLVTNLAVFLLYLAWVGALFQQLSTDASYWQGRLKVWEAFYSVALRFTQGETVLESAARSGLLLYACITLLLLLALSGQARRQYAARRTLGYALSWLLVPVAGVLGLVAFIPKFNARYVMLALPGLLLVWSGGIALLFPSDQPTRQRITFMYLARQLGGVVLLLLLLMGFRNANRNWFTDPAFTKAQWRELAAYVHHHHKPDEAILLVSGHAWPIWNYYAPDLPAIRLPDIEILDVNAVLDFANTGKVLQSALRGKRGVWLINWQDEVVDPNGVAARQLLSAAQEEHFKNEFWQLRLRHFVDLAPTAIRTTPPVATVVNANFDNQLYLQSYMAAPDGDLLLFWQLGSAPQTPLPDLHINLRTETATSLLYADPTDRRPADYEFPVMRWEPGQTVMGRIPAPEWAGAGALPGNYRVQLGVHDPAGDPVGFDLIDGAGNQMGKVVTLEVNLAQTTPSEPPPSAVDDTEILDGVRLAFPVDEVTAEPGQAAPVALDWFLEKRLTTAPELRLQWRTAKDAPIAASTPLSMTAVSPMTAWPVEHWLRQVIAVQPPPTLPPGDYLLEVLAKGRDNPARRPFTVLPSTRNFTPPPLAMATNVDFAQTSDDTTAQVRLLGLTTVLPTTVTAGEQLTLDLVWQSTASTAPAADYVATVQLLGSDGRPIAQVDQPLPGGAASWVNGQIERQTVALNTSLEPGDYPLILALYSMTSTGFPRLVTAGGDDFVTLGVVTVQ